MEAYDLLEVVDTPAQGVADLLGAPRSTVCELYFLDDLPSRRLVVRAGAGDRFVRNSDPPLSLAQYIQRLVDERQRVHIPGIALPRPEVFVLALQFRVGDEPGLFPAPFRSPDSLGFRLKRGTRPQRLAYRFCLAQLRLCR